MPTTNDLLSLLARASDLLGSTLEPGEVMWSLARLVVPSLADWSIITLVGADGMPTDVEAWHRDPEMRETTRAFAEHRFTGRSELRGSMSALSSGTPFVQESGAEAYARATLRSDEAIAALDVLDLESAVVVPMLSGGEVIGAITLLRGRDRAPMSPPELTVAVDLARRASVTLGNARSYERERTASEQLQLSMLTEPVAPDHLEVVTRYVPAAEAAQIGGDWYDVFPQADGSTVLVVGDVAGHDIAAAAMMGQLRSILRGIAVTTGAGPAELLGQLDRAIAALRMEACATVVVCRLEQGPDGVHLTYSNAGHPAPFLLHADGSVVGLAEHDTMLGVVPDWPRREARWELEKGSTLLMFSDGLVENRREDIDVGRDALAAALADGDDPSLRRLVDRVLAELLPTHHDDDVAVLAVRLR